MTKNSASDIESDNVSRLGHSTDESLSITSVGISELNDPVRNIEKKLVERRIKAEIQRKEQQYQAGKKSLSFELLRY